MEKREEGITLVALMITIIILIILAAVTILTVTNHNIIGKAGNGAEEYAKGQEYELGEMNNVTKILNELENKILGGSETEGEDNLTFTIELYKDRILVETIKPYIGDCKNLYDWWFSDTDVFGSKNVTHSYPGGYMDAGPIDIYTTYKGEFWRTNPEMYYCFIDDGIKEKWFLSTSEGEDIELALSPQFVIKFYAE